MKKERLVRHFLVTSVIILFSLLFIVTNKSFALEDVDNYSELYKQYLELSDEEKEKVGVIPEKYNTSLKEYNANNAKKTAKRLKTASKLPNRYNLAEHYNIKVENQGSEGTCWTFASLETLETYLQIHGYGTFDFSENHLNYVESNLFSQTMATRKVNTSGGFSEFQEYINKKYGPVSEEEYPYYIEKGSSIQKKYTQDELTTFLDITPMAYIGEYVSFPSVNKEYNQYTETELVEFRKTVKNHIMENGAIFTIVTAPNYYTGEFYNDNSHSAYFPTTSDFRFMENSHAVAIIGWDDDFSKDNFISENKPEHDGAYIALNSWGSSFGECGLYYISYDDAFVEQNLKGIKEAVTDISELKSTKTFTIKDKNLYRALKDSIGSEIVSYNDNNNEITLLNGKLNQISSLNLSNYNITDLSGIENFTNLYTINLSHNDISNIEPLLELHDLKDLDLRYNSFTKIPDELKNADLDSLALSYNPISDFSGLADIKSIVRLELEGTDVKEDDLRFIKNLKIISLNLSKTRIKDYSLLKTLNNEVVDPDRDLNLQELNLSYNNDILYSSIPSVGYLNISYTNTDEDRFNQVPDISRLEALDISYTNIKDLSVLSNCHLNSISISGNKNLKNIDILKSARYVTYEDAGLKDVSIFKNFYSSQLSLAQNEIEDYSDLLENEFLNFVDLSNNKIKTTHYSEKTRVLLDGNYIKPEAGYFDTIESMNNQNYTETLKADPSRDNIFTEIGEDLYSLHSAGIKLDIVNANMDYDTKMFSIDNYDKDVIIKIENGIYKGSKITYKIEKNEGTNISYIYINRSNLKTTYIEGEKFDASGLEVYAVYDNNSMSPINDFAIIGGDDLHVGNNQIKVQKDGFEDYIEVSVISNDDIATLAFENKYIYEATLKKIGDIEKERQEYPEYFASTQVLISKDDANKSIKILKDDLKNISYIEVKSDENISLEDLKQLKGLSGISIDGKNIEDLSVLTYFKEILDNTEDLLPYERFLALEIKNNERINHLEENIYRSLVVENSKIKDINNLSNLSYLKYKGNELPEMNSILDKIRLLYIDVTSTIEDAQRDENENIILPDLLKAFKDKGLEIEVNICDQIRDEQYLNPYNKKQIEITENDDGKLILDYDSIKNIDYEGNNQFIEISVKDINNIYMDFDFKYNIKYKISDDTNPSEDEQEDDDESEHTHEWGEWVVTKEPTEDEEGQKERVCLKNNNHKEIAKIDKLPARESETKNENDSDINNIEKDSGGYQENNTSENNENNEKTENIRNNSYKTYSSPKTGDSIDIYLMLFFSSIFGLGIAKRIN